MTTPVARRRAVRIQSSALEEHEPPPLEIDATDDDDDLDLASERLERVDRFSSAGSFDWVGPED
jgi:hypothetical protein